MIVTLFKPFSSVLKCRMNHDNFEWNKHICIAKKKRNSRTYRQSSDILNGYLMNAVQFFVHYSKVTSFQVQMFKSTYESESKKIEFLRINMVVDQINKRRAINNLFAGLFMESHFYHIQRNYKDNSHYTWNQSVEFDRWQSLYGSETPLNK